MERAHEGIFIDHVATDNTAAADDPARTAPHPTERGA